MAGQNGKQQSSNDRPFALAIALLLTGIAGIVDAVGFLSFARIYTANMSGNSVAVGIALGETNWRMAFFRFWPVLIYMLSLFFGRIILEVGARTKVSRIGTVVFVLESIVLATAAYVGDLPRSSDQALTVYAAIALLAFAMGTQNAALTHFSTVTIHTGFVTGTLLKAASEVVKTITWAWDTLREQGRFGSTMRQAATRESSRLGLFLLLAWVSYVLGAVLGSVSTKAFKANSVFVAIAGLVFLTLIDLREPLAAQDESQQNQGS